MDGHVRRDLGAVGMIGGMRWMEREEGGCDDFRKK
jgi:hypothetical protein